MITSLDPSAELFLADVARIQQRLATANRQVSSGKRIASAADAPDQIGSLLQLRAARERNTQIQSNLVLAKADADSADSALASAIKLMDRALTLASEGTNPTQTNATRQSLALEVQSLQEQMVAYSQTAVQGRYIFSGDRNDSAAYTFDITSANNSVVELTAASATSRIEDPAGGAFANSKAAQEIFDTRNNDAVPATADTPAVPATPAADNVFRALDNLRRALLSNDTARISSAIDPLKQASTHLNNMEAFYGTVQSRIQSATEYSKSYEVRLLSEISQKEDADITGAALEVTSATTQLQAAFQMRARLPHTSLFDYLG